MIDIQTIRIMYLHFLLLQSKVKRSQSTNHKLSYPTVNRLLNLIVVSVYQSQDKKCTMMHLTMENIKRAT